MLLLVEDIDAMISHIHTAATSTSIIEPKVRFTTILAITILESH